MKINAKQIESVIALAGSERYKHFVKVVADWEEVWGLYQDGWALASTDDGQTVFPLWPAKEYAQLCADKEWSGYEPESFSLEDFMDELLPNLKDDGVLPGIFYTPSDKGVTPTVDQLLGGYSKFCVSLDEANALRLLASDCQSRKRSIQSEASV